MPDDAPLWLTVLLTMLGFGGGYASAFVAQRSTQVDQETARRAETRERVFEAVKMLLPASRTRSSGAGSPSCRRRTRAGSSTRTISSS